jgi:hypothetical protein
VSEITSERPTGLFRPRSVALVARDAVVTWTIKGQS